MAVIHVRTQVRWFRKQTSIGTWMGWCDELGLTLEADDLNELASMIDEGMHTLFISLLEDGELEAFLRRRGWTSAVTIPSSISADDDVGLLFKVPYELLEEHAAAG